MNWQPIETAPKDCDILVYDTYNGGTFYVACWAKTDTGDDAWGYAPDTFAGGCLECVPTHWMPLPEPPKGKMK
jgi:Protein of unknown function (DUF551)